MQATVMGAIILMNFVVILQNEACDEIVMNFVALMVISEIDDKFYELKNNLDIVSQIIANENGIYD